jgi:flagellar assembly protein FliH
MESLQKSLSDAAASRAELMEKKASVEADLARVKEAAAQREREMAESIEAAKEQARVEGKTLGHAEGLENGYQEGLKKAGIEVAEQYREKFTGLTDRLEGFSTKLDARFSELVALNEPRMLRLWQEMLEKMLQREMALEPDGVLDALSGVLARLSDKSRVLIYVAPEDLDLLDQSLQGEFGDVLRNVKHLELKSDANVDRGSCIVETNLGVYDARWRTQFDQIDTEIENLFQKLGKPPKPKETARRIRKGDRAENTAPQPEQARFGQAQPEQTQPEQTQSEQTQSERTQPEPARPEQPRLKSARSEQAAEKPKPAARKRASSKRGKIEENAV